jgi:hypothetical protein
MRNASLFSLLLVLTPLIATAQTTTAAATASVNESDLRACLLAEQEGMARFSQLEQRANELKGTEQLLTQRRADLQKRQRKLDQGVPDPADVEALNNMVRVFNEQTDQLNTDKTGFETDVRSNETWMTNTLKPACAPIINKPVAVVTSFYACGFDQQGDLAELPHCKSLPNLDALKDCVSKAGSKTKAQEICNVQN